MNIWKGLSGDIVKIWKISGPGSSNLNAVSEWIFPLWMKTRKITTTKKTPQKTKTRVIKDSQDERLSLTGSSITVMNIMVKTRGVGTQSSRAVNQMGFLSSWVEIGFHRCKLECFPPGRPEITAGLWLWRPGFWHSTSWPLWWHLLVRLKIKT